MSTNPSYDFDLVVIGGGSGGLACAKEATAVNPSAKVAVFDFVKPTIRGTKWGLGGTCVNVGCIPKKLMHHSANIGHLMTHHAQQFGWNIREPPTHRWSDAQRLVGDYIKSLNFAYRISLQSAAVKYFEAYATFVDEHTLSYSLRSGKGGNVTFARAVIATGGRPTYPAIPGAELAITSDDVFWLKSAPGPRVLVVGAGYIALECASFLSHIGNDVTVMIRGQILRKMDTQSGEQIGELMERDGVRFLKPAKPIRFDSVNAAPIPADAKRVTDDKFELAESTPTVKLYQYTSGSKETVDALTQKQTFTLPNGPIRVTYEFAGATRTEIFDNVLIAVGRTANTGDLNLNRVDVAVVNGKILVDDTEATSNPHIYAIGDVATGIPAHRKTLDIKKLEDIAVDRPELTPVAIQAGVFLARRLFAGASHLMPYRYIPTTVFTSPSEYAYVGLSEEQARRNEEDGGIGADNVEVFWSRYGSIEQSPLHPELHYKPPKSSAFVGANLWARRQVDDTLVDWPEAMFDPDSNAAVIVAHNGQRRAGRVVKVYRNTDGRSAYDVVTDDDQTTLTAVDQSRLELSSEAEADNSAIWSKASSLAKVIVDKRNDRIVGLHFVGDAAGEVVQGFALAVSVGATKSQLDALVGIHPTSAEEFAVLTVTKQSKLSGLKQAGCGGGRCG